MSDTGPPDEHLNPASSSLRNDRSYTLTQPLTDTLSIVRLVITDC